MRKTLILLGHLSLIVTTILALFFYKDRVFFVDPCQQLFQMINEDGFVVYNSRYSMMINQSLPLLFIKCGLPLQYIVIAYSMSFVIIYYLCFIIAVYGFKNIAAGLSIAFAPIIIRLAFGHSISEAWLGVAYSAVFYALLNYYDKWKDRGILFMIFFFLLIVVVIGVNYLIHPITLFTLGFAIGFTYFYKKEYKRPYIYVAAAMVLIIYMYKFFFPGDEHDENFFEGIKKADQLLPNLRNLPLLWYLKHAFFTTYIYPAIVMMMTALLLIRNKKTMVLSFVIGFCILYTLIAALAFYKGDAHSNLESRYIPLIFFIIIPFTEVLKDKKRSIAWTSALSLLLIFSYISLIKQVDKGHTERIRLYQSALAEAEKYPERKFYVKIPTDRYSPMNSWGSATETLMLSSLEGKSNSRTIIFYDDRINIFEGMDYFPCLYIWVPWHLFANEIKMLNPSYFDLQCSKYRELTYPTNF